MDVSYHLVLIFCELSRVFPAFAEDKFSLSASIGSCNGASFWTGAMALLQAHLQLSNEAQCGTTTVHMANHHDMVTEIGAQVCRLVIILHLKPLDFVRSVMVRPSVRVRRATSGVGPWNWFLAWVLLPSCRTPHAPRLILAGQASHYVACHPHHQNSTEQLPRCYKAVTPRFLLARKASAG